MTTPKHSQELAFHSAHEAGPWPLYGLPRALILHPWGLGTKETDSIS